jgi:Flp pilus assembly protein TadB
MPELDIILDAIKEMKDSHHECMESVREEMRAGLRSAAVHINSEMEVVNYRISQLTDHVATQNSNVASLQNESNNRAQAVKDFREHEKKHLKRDAWIKKNMMWIILGVFLIVSIIVAIVDIVGVKVIVTKAIEKVSMI